MEFVFGPVPSRRLGNSLGINLVPHKICSFDCLYCEVGKTTELTLDRQSFFDPEQLIQSVHTAYADYKDMLSVVTLTGAGEPTLNMDLGDIIKQLKSFIQHPLAILTNSSLIDQPAVQNELLQLDIVVPSLDAVTPSLFESINKPHPAQNLDRLIDEFISFSNRFTGKLFPEVLILKGINDSPSEIEQIASVLIQCRYNTVHLNTAFRPPAYSTAMALSDTELLDISMQFRSLGVNIEPAAKFIKSLSGGSSTTVKHDIFKLLSMRPCTADEISAIFDMPVTQVKSILAVFLAQQTIKEELHNQLSFYSSVDI